jgi:hypothetical protein
MGRQPGRNRFCGDCFRIGGNPPGTRTVGVAPFGLVDERIGDLSLIEALARSIDTIAGPSVVLSTW